MRPSNDLYGLKLTLGGYFIILALKPGAYWMNGVMALLAEALHTLSDIFVAGFLLVAATLFISFTSFELCKESIPRLFSAETIEYQNLSPAIGVPVVSMVIAAAPLITLFRRKTRSPEAKAQLTEPFNEELGLLTALLGTLSITWGWKLGDPLAAILIATIIADKAAGLCRENPSFLLGGSPIVVSVPGVLGVHVLRAEYIGPG